MRALLFLLATAASAQTITSGRYGDTLANYTAVERKLNRTSATNIHKIGAYTADGDVYGQPLYAPSLSIAGGTHNALFFCTQNNTCYAYDADERYPSTATALWSTHFEAPAINHLTPGYFDRAKGCTSTPVIDVATSRLWVVCAAPDDAIVPCQILYRIRKLNLLTGAVITTQTITASVTGTGTGGTLVGCTDPMHPTIISGPDPVSGGVLSFWPQTENQRTDLRRVGGNILVGFGSWNDAPPYHGWLMAYDEVTLAQTHVLCITPNAAGGGIWSTASATAIDGSNHIFVMTGNGDFDAVTSWGESLLRLDSSFNIVDSWTPTDWATLNAFDLDIAGVPMLIPGTTKIAIGAKDYKVYVLDGANLGGVGGELQSFITNPMAPYATHEGIYGGTLLPGSSGGFGYWPNTFGAIYQFAYDSSGVFNTTPVLSGNTYFYPGAQSSASANGTSQGILWSVIALSAPSSTAPLGALLAINSNTMAVIYDSSVLSQDALGHVAKFSTPVVVAGKVYISTLDGVAVYRTPPNSIITGQGKLTGTAKLQ